MATCEEVELRLLELFGDNPPDDLVLHLKVCASCRGKRDEWARLWMLMDRWEDDKPSDKVEDAARSEILNSLRRGAARRRRLSWSNVAERFVPLLAATAAAFLGVALAVRKVGPAIEPLSPLALLMCGVVWMAVYSVMFFLSVEKAGGMYRIQGVQTSTLARYALIALGIWLFLAGVTEFSGLGRFAAETFLPSLTVSWYFFVGIAYSFIPLVSASFFIRDKRLIRAKTHGALLGGFFLFLLTPEIFLYCSSFTFGIAFSWTVGTILGCIAGGPAGVWLSQRGIKVMEGAT